jgi:hypothetical protein
MEEDKDLNNAILNLIKKCEVKGVVGVERVVADYQVKFRYTKLKDTNIKGTISTQTEQIGGALSNMGDEITKTFAGI